MTDIAHRFLTDPKEIRILAFGNSLTEGYCDYGTRFHPYSIALKAELSKLVPELNVTVDVNGLSGDMVLSSLAGVFMDRLQKAVPRRPSRRSYDFVILLGGTNDLAYTFGDPDGPRTIFKGLERCYEHVLGSGASLVCLTIPERLLDTKNTNMAKQGRSARLEVNALIEKYVEEHQNKSAAKEERVFVMDYATRVPFVLSDDENGGRSANDPGLWSVDGLHMTDKGYDHVGELLAQFLADLLKKG